MFYPQNKEILIEKENKILTDRIYCSPKLGQVVKVELINLSKKQRHGKAEQTQVQCRLQDKSSN